jgi:hypothetical protein
MNLITQIVVIASITHPTPPVQIADEPLQITIRKVFQTRTSFVNYDVELGVKVW